MAARRARGGRARAWPAQDLLVEALHEPVAAVFHLVAERNPLEARGRLVGELAAKVAAVREPVRQLASERRARLLRIAERGVGRRAGMDPGTEKQEAPAVRDGLRQVTQGQLGVSTAKWRRCGDHGSPRFDGQAVFRQTVRTASAAAADASYALRVASRAGKDNGAPGCSLRRLRFDHRLQRARVGRRERLPVVVEVGVDVAILGPLADRPLPLA